MGHVYLQRSDMTRAIYMHEYKFCCGANKILFATCFFFRRSSLRQNKWNVPLKHDL